MNTPKYKQTKLWKRTLGEKDPVVDNFRTSYEKTRKTVAVLLEKIHADFPFLTDHSISHVDALWEVADTLIGPRYVINPLEGYILGIAFLIHDIALSYYTVGGVDALRKTPEWLDAHAEGCPAGKKEEDFEKECDFVAIRNIHAEKVENILEVEFTPHKGKPYYILEEEELRKQYGTIIGLIAGSHHWDIEKVEAGLAYQFNPIGDIPREWTIHPHKLACILRCADAGHIDISRASDAERRSAEITENSENHWTAQNHLTLACKDETEQKKLCFTSGNPFPRTEAAAWTLAYDLICQFDNEIRKSNRLLKKLNLEPFPFVGVSGVSSKEAMKKYIKTAGWEPCDIGVRASNIKALIESLGGLQLYGDSAPFLVVLRELIQNARDAVHARYKQDEGFNLEDGKIVIRVKTSVQNKKKVHTIEVEDNGLGMSLDCIKHFLLDFGSSYWGSSLSKKEYPGLRSSGFVPIGRFGIGFYSIFMVAKSVDVFSRQYLSAQSDTWRVEFPQGLTLSPILSPESLGMTLTTLVRFELKEEYWDEFRLWEKVDEPVDKHFDILNTIQVLVAGLDVDVYYDDGHGVNCIHTSVSSSGFNKDEWFKELLKSGPMDVKKSDEIASQLEKLVDRNGAVRGWIAPPITDEDVYLPCIETFGGLYSSISFKDAFFPNGTLLRYIGFLDYKSGHISRGRVDLDPALKICLRQWARNQFLKHHQSILDSDCVARNFVNLIQLCDISDDLIAVNAFSLYSEYLRSFTNPLFTVGFIDYIRDWMLKGAVQIEPLDCDALAVAIQQTFPGFSGDRTKTKVPKPKPKPQQPSQSPQQQPQQESKDNSSQDIPEELVPNAVSSPEELLPTEPQSFKSTLGVYLNLYFYLKREGLLDTTVLRVWLNLMLHNFLPGRVIDWELKDIEDKLINYLANREKLSPDDHAETLEKILVPSKNYLERLEGRKKNVKVKLP